MSYPLLELYLFLIVLSVVRTFFFSYISYLLLEVSLFLHVLPIARPLSLSACLTHRYKFIISYMPYQLLNPSHFPNMSQH